MGQTTAADLEALLAVSDLDTAVAQLQHRRQSLAERVELAAVSDRIGETDRRAGELRGQRDELAARLADLEDRRSSTSTRRHEVEQRLYGARHTAARDLQAMDDEYRHLGARLSELEEAELELMVAADPLDAELAELEASRARLGDEAAVLAGRLAEAESSLDAELSQCSAERQRTAAGVPSSLLERYDRLAARLGGTGAARLVGNRCGGCHLELPSMEVDRIRHLEPGTVATCDQCGRILVPAPPAPASSS